MPREISPEARRARALQSRRRKLEEEVEKTCPVCGEPFRGSRAHMARRTCCSMVCAAKRKRERAGERKGKANPNYRHGRRVGQRDRAGERLWRAARGKRCAVPGCRNPGGRWLAQHHVIYEQVVRRNGGDVFDPRNSLTLCDVHHAKHHKRSEPLSIEHVPDAAFEFASELLGPGKAFNEFRRSYVGDDPRLDALLAAHEMASVE